MNLLNLTSAKITDENQLSPLFRFFLKMALKSRGRFFIGRVLEIFAALLPAIIIFLYVSAAYYVATRCPGIQFPPIYLLLSILISVFFALFIGKLGNFLSLLGKRLRVCDAPTLLAKDPRAPILYLRSFMQEVIAGDNYIGVRDEDLTKKSDEQLIYEVVRLVGPMIAIGRPGDPLPPIGAARVYLGPSSDWQSVIKDYLAQAQFVIVSPEWTPGVLWEGITVFQLCRPEQIIISLLAPGAYKESRAHILEEAERSNVLINLPEDVGKSSFIYFDSDSTPRLADNLEQVFLDKDVGLKSNQLKRKQLWESITATTFELSKLLLVLSAIIFPVAMFFLAGCNP